MRVMTRHIRPLNFCVKCENDFTSLTLFDRHRVGSHQGDDRRCLSEREMLKQGWERDANGRWIDPEARDRARESFARVRTPQIVRRRFRLGRSR
jgi:hypothetical protein